MRLLAPDELHHKHRTSIKSRQMKRNYFQSVWPQKSFIHVFSVSLVRFTHSLSIRSMLWAQVKNIKLADV